MDNFAHLFFPLIIGIQLSTTQVESKHCYYTDEGTTEYYFCGTYEYCCKGGCCESFITFYRLWYFWFAVATVLLFCSGGGFWYHKRYIQQRVIVSQSPPNAAIVSMAPVSQEQQRSSYIYPADGLPISEPVADNPPSYSQVCHAPARYPYGISTANGGILLNTNAVVYQATSYGPPPSYDSVRNIRSQGPPVQPAS